MTPKIDLGKTYYGPAEQRMRALRIDGDRVTVQYPLSLNEKVISLHEMREFIAGSSSRTYHLPVKGGMEIRTKVEEFAVAKGDPRTQPFPGRKPMRPGRYVTYITPDKQRHTVPAPEWAKWRAKVKA